MSFGWIKSPSAGANCSPSSPESPLYPASWNTGFLSQRRAPRFPGAGVSSPTESHAFQFPTAARKATCGSPAPLGPQQIQPTSYLASPHHSSCPWTCRWVYMASSSPAETQGRDIFPVANGCSRFPQSSQLHPSGKAWGFFPIGKGLCWEGLVSQGLQPNPRGLWRWQGAGEGMRCRHQNPLVPGGGGGSAKCPPPPPSGLLAG